MRAVLAAAVDLAEQLHLVELIVAIRVAQPVEPVRAGLLVHHDVEAVEGVEQPVRAGDVGLQLLHRASPFAPGGGTETR